MIDGVIVNPLNCIHDEQGIQSYVMLNSRETVYKGFGELYFSLVYPNIIKGWHLHQKMILNYTVLVGKINLVLFDPREESQTKGEVMELLLEDSKHSLVQVPSLIWTGFKGLGYPYSIVANCSTIPHFENEISRLDPFSTKIPYDWNRKDE